jgi:hypothetical protein
VGPEVVPRRRSVAAMDYATSLLKKQLKGKGLLWPEPPRLRHGGLLQLLRQPHRASLQSCCATPWTGFLRASLTTSTSLSGL